MRNYEFMLILRANLDKKVADETIDKIVALINNKNGQATRVKGWGRRKLAYEIDKQSEGIYALFKVTLAPHELEDIKFNLKLDENIIRYVFVKDPVAKPPEASNDEVEAPVVSDDDSEKDNVSEDTPVTEPSSDASTVEDTSSSEDTPSANEDTPSSEDTPSANEDTSSSEDTPSANEDTSSSDEATSTADVAEESTSEAPADESSKVEAVNG